MKVELNLNNESFANLVMISYCYRRSNETCSGELPWDFDIINPIGIKTCTYMKLTFHLFSPDAEWHEKGNRIGLEKIYDDST